MSAWQYTRNGKDGVIESIFKVKYLNGESHWFILCVNGTRYKLEDVTDDGEVYLAPRGWVPTFTKEADIRAIRQVVKYIRNEGAVSLRGEGKVVRFQEWKNKDDL